MLGSYFVRKHSGVVKNSGNTRKVISFIDFYENVYHCRSVRFNGDSEVKKTELHKCKWIILIDQLEDTHLQ